MLDHEVKSNIGNENDVLPTSLNILKMFDPCLAAKWKDSITILRLQKPAEDLPAQVLSPGNVSDSDNDICRAEASEKHADYDNDTDVLLPESDTASCEGNIADSKDAYMTSNNGLDCNNEAR